jgi:hypothetical protein
MNVFGRYPSIYQTIMKIAHFTHILGSDVLSNSKNVRNVNYYNGKVQLDFVTSILYQRLLLSESNFTAVEITNQVN